MALVPYTITALAESDSQGTDGKNIVAGATCSMYSQPSDSVVTLYDDAAGSNGSTSKVTGANGQVVVYVEPGSYRVSVNAVDSYTLVGAEVTDLRYDNVAEMITNSVDAGKTINLNRYYSGGDLVDGLEYYIKTSAQASADGDVADGFINHTLVTGNIAVLQHNGIITSSQFGLTESNTVSLFSIFSYAKAYRIYIENGTYTYDNSLARLGLQDNCEYIGLGDVYINFTDETQRLIHTVNKSGFSLKNIKTNGNTESMETSLGGGYWRFENCSDFEIDNWEVSKHGFDGIKCEGCSQFKITNGVGKWGKSSAINCTACTDFSVTGNTLSKQGRNSVDDSYADLPTGWTGTQVGRGITVSTGCVDFKILNNKCELNSEYGIRIFQQGLITPCQRGSIESNECIDNGAPSGTYGTIVLADDKGTDIFVNGEPTGGADDTQDITVSNNTVRRSLTYGDPISLAGTNLHVKENNVFIAGAGEGQINAFFLFGPKFSQFENNKSWGAKAHYIVGSSNPTNLYHSGDRAFDCVSFYQSQAAGTTYLSDAIALHNSTLAVSGEDGFVSFSGSWRLRDVTLDGFHRGIQNVSTDVHFTNVETKNSVDVGFRNFQEDSSGVIQKGCNWESANPDEKGAVVYESTNDRASGMSFAFSQPSTGYYKAGHIVFDSQPDIAVTGRQRIGWYRLISGINHVAGTDWQEMWVPIASS